MTASACESMRYVLPAGAPLLANLAALWLADPELAAELEALPDDAAYEIETARSDDPTLAQTTADGRRIYLHSRFKPTEEAERTIRGVEIKDKQIFYVFGFGLGYHVEALWTATNREGLICVFEPDLRMLWTALSCRDYSKMIAGQHLLILHKSDKTEILNRLVPLSAVVTLGSKAICHSPSAQLHSAYFEQVQVWLEELASFARTGMNTLVYNSAKTAENIAANIAWYAASPSIARLKNRYAGYPGIIVSAGPSLRKNKHLLAGLEDRAVMIAVQTTLKPLVEMGVRPQFVTSLDYHEICSRFFEKLPPDLKTELVAEPKATESIFHLHPGPMTMLGNDFAEGLIREIKLHKATLTAGATVAHLAYYLATHLGCDPIIFVGQDLAFSDGLCYAPGTSYDDVWRPELSRFCSVEMKQWEQIVRDRYVLRRVPDADGNPIYTEERLFMYLQQFERDFAASKARIIDATEGGALKRGATPMPLASVIAEHCTRALPEISDDHGGMNWSLLEQCIASVAKRRQEAAEIARIGRETLPLLEEIGQSLSDQARVNRLIGRIDQIRARMNEFGRTYDLVTQLTQDTELKRFERDRNVAASGASGAERQRLQIERDTENVRALTDAASKFEALMEQTIRQLESRLQPRALAA